MIKSNKRIKYITIVTVMLLFISIIGYSLSFFNRDEVNLISNIKVNDLAFNITTNSGTSDDRILHLQAGKTESFNIIITNLNKISTKYELIYEVCSDAKCTNKLNELPEEVEVGLNSLLTNEVSGTIETDKTAIVNLLTENNTTQDYYIKLNLNVGYVWNDLALVNQFDYFGKKTSIIAYVDGVEVNEYPDGCNYIATLIGYKGGNEVENKAVTCDGSTKKWSISYTGFVNKIKIYFEKTKKLFNYIASLDKTKNGLEIDDTSDKNLRYVGASPNNYLTFNNETWRIIGVFNNITTIDEQGNETKESLVKIIRNDSLGKYSWDSSASSANRGYGINEWSQADLMTELNTDYINTSPTSDTTLWYNAQNNNKSGTYDYSKSIKSNSIDKIAKVRWNLGGNSTPIVSALNMYNAERGTLHIGSITDGVERTNTWDGKIALMYPSDYGYASSDATCRININSSNCKSENWLFDSTYQWTLSPSSNAAYDVFYVNSNGYVFSFYAYYNSDVRPVLFLKSDVEFSGGTGESVANAFVLE